MTAFENHAGFTITNSKLQVVEVNFKNEQYVLENIDEAYFNEQLDLENDKEAKIISLMQGAFNELLLKKPLNSSSVSFALPLDVFSIIQLPYDNSLLHQDLIEQFRWELSVLFPYLNTKDLVIQYFEIEKNYLVDYNSALVISTYRKYLQLLYKFCQKNNLNLKFIDNSHLASDRAIAASNPNKVKSTVLSIYIDNHNLSLIVSYNGRPQLAKLFRLNSAYEITTILRNEFNSDNSKLNKYVLDSAFISGEDISNNGVKLLCDTTGIKLEYFNPFSTITPNPLVEKNIYFLEKYNSFSPAAGLAYRLA